MLHRFFVFLVIIFKEFKQFLHSQNRINWCRLVAHYVNMKVFMRFINYDFRGIGEPKYMPVLNWQSLSKILNDALRSYNELNAAMDLVLFEDAMSHICKINRILESPRGNALLVGVGGSGKQSLSRLAAYISSMEVFQVTLRKGYCSTDLKADLANLYQKTGLKNLGTVFLMTDAQVLYF